MILARLTRAMRQQNWFAVALEFVIVILGVVIGVQVTAWNSARQAAWMKPPFSRACIWISNWRKA